MPDSHDRDLRHEIVSLSDHLNRLVVDQSHLVERLMIALLADGHLLVEGAPGLAKTRVVKLLASGIEADFKRIQFTPDLLPSDLTGTEVYRPQDASFRFQRGPLFNHIIVADEINRAPAKVQSALLEAMEERQVTVGLQSYALTELFFVMATQNPIEHEGTYPLPEAQLDRFLMKVSMDYPGIAAEQEIMRQQREEILNPTRDILSTDGLPISQDTLFRARRSLLDIYMAPPVEEYIAQLVHATRNPERWDDQLQGCLRYGASPRATLAFDRCTRALAWLENRDYVSPDDVQRLAREILGHRLVLDYRADTEGFDADSVIARLLQRVPVP